ncbi:MAG TPA: class I SAM-dependent methyltransferase [Vicinamibacterales bacterium]|nr:class I SAM-dependent methyltransferase [Vicinamibacterales bacterium]
MTKLYNELAEWWPLLSAPEDYEEEATFYFDAMQEVADRRIDTMLELGSGGGNNASFMKHRVQELVLVDLSEGMLVHSRKLNPECRHHVGDMRRVRLNRLFDAVFVHDAVSYMTTEADVAAAITTAAVHCRPGGAALFAPDHVRETFKPGTDCGGHDGTDRSMRYLSWAWDPDPGDTTCVTDYAYLLRESDGTVRVVHDRHIEGLLSRDTWLRLFKEAGFEPHVVPFNHSELEPGTYELFVCVKRG